MVLPARWVSIDPGDKYVGLATWENERCVKVVETDPNGLVNTLEWMCDRDNRCIETVVCEKWELYPWLQKSLAGNEFLTSQLIGVIKYLANRGGVLYVGQLARIGKSTYHTGWFKGLTLDEMKAMPFWEPEQQIHGRKKDHCRDAWSHGMYYKKSQLGVWDRS